jgi:hypothetical protein
MFTDVDGRLIGLKVLPLGCDISLIAINEKKTLALFRSVLSMCGSEDEAEEASTPLTATGAKPADLCRWNLETVLQRRRLAGEDTPVVSAFPDIEPHGGSVQSGASLRHALPFRAATR